MSSEQILVLLMCQAKASAKMTMVRQFPDQDISILQKSSIRTTLSDCNQEVDHYLEMNVLQESPNSHDFIPLSEHQSATPASFYSGPPVLHHHSGRCKVVILEGDLSKSPALTALTRQAPQAAATAETVANGNGDHAEEEDEAATPKVLEGVDVWVTSEYSTPPVCHIRPRC